MCVSTIQQVITSMLILWPYYSYSFNWSKLSDDWYHVYPKTEISHPKLYGILVKTKLKGDTVLDLNIFYNQINISIQSVTKLK